MEELLAYVPMHIQLKWLLLLAPLFFLLVWYHYQHIFFRSLGQKSQGPFSDLMRAFRWRAGQVCAIWCIAMALVVQADIRYYELLAQLDTADFADTPQAPAAAQEILEPLDFNPTATIGSTDSAPQPSSPATQDAALMEASLDEVKFRYEDAFVSYLYLQRCQQADINDLTRINDALAKEINALGADPQIQYSIYSAAQGSFEGIYADTPCDAAYLAPMLQQFRAFMERIR